MRGLLIIYFFILSGLTFAQYTFRYEYDSIRSSPVSFTETDDGYVIAGGKQPTQGSYDLHLTNSQLIKLNKEGELLWTTEINEPYYDNIFSIKQDGQFLYGLGIGFTEIDRSYTYFLKFDLNGTLLIKKEIGTISYTSRDNQPTDLILKKDGTILVNNSEFNFVTNNTESVVYQLDKNGVILKRTAFTQDTLSCIPQDLAETSDNGFILVMSALSLDTFEDDIYIIKSDFSGNEVWRTFIQTNDPVQTDFSVCNLDNAIYCAMATSYVNGGPARLSIVKYDETGNALFETNFVDYSPPAPESFDFPRISLNHDTTGLLIFGDYASSTTGFNPTLLLADLNGNILKSITYPFRDTVGNGWGTDMHPTSDNGIAMLVRNYYLQPQIGHKTELIKTDCDGNLDWRDECSFVDTEMDVLIFPNPSSGNYTFQLQNVDENAEIELQIYDNIGRLISLNAYKSRFFSVDISSVTHGVYYYVLIVNQSEYANGKLIKI